VAKKETKSLNPADGIDDSRYIKHRAFDENRAKNFEAIAEFIQLLFPQKPRQVVTEGGMCSKLWVYGEQLKAIAQELLGR
jgi:hypothetical protein